MKILIILLTLAFSINLQAQEYEKYEFEGGYNAMVATVRNNADEGLMKSLYLGLYGNGNTQSRFLGFDFVSSGNYNINIEAGDGVKLQYTHFLFSRLIDSEVKQSVSSTSSNSFNIKKITNYKIRIPVKIRRSVGIIGGVEYATDIVSGEKSLLNDYSLASIYTGISYQSIKHAFIKVESSPDKQGTTINNFFITAAYYSVQEKENILPLLENEVRTVVPRVGYQGRLGYWTPKGRGGINFMLAYQPSVIIKENFNWLLGLGISWSWN